MFSDNTLSFKIESLNKTINLKYIKDLGKLRTKENYDHLIKLFEYDIPIKLKREVVSSIGRHHNLDDIFSFIKSNVFITKEMDLIYQMYRTLLYKSKIDTRFEILRNEVRSFYNNEVINRMEKFYLHKQNKNNKIDFRPTRFTKTPILLEGDNKEKLKSIPDGSVQLIFTSPPYYNAKEYSNYSSYKEYLFEIKKTLIECQRVLEEGRFIIINVSPVISARPGREFESIRYPIHFDFHHLLVDAGFYFVDEILWTKPEPSVPYRIGSFEKLKKPLMYKPKNITESILVYRKDSPFLVEENIALYPKDELVYDSDNIDTTNIWVIPPKSIKNHPAVFPELLCEKIIKYYSFKNDIVLDPFAGSGTLGKVAIRMDRVPILCEINTSYINTIKNNIIKTDN